jgi:trehalose synthase-fused probable maltokinase
VLAGWLARQRWFATKTRRVQRLEVEDVLALGPGTLALVRVVLDDGRADRYCLTLGGDAGGEVADGLDDPACCRALLDLALGGGRAESRAGAVVGRATHAVPPALAAGAPIHRVGGEQTNSSVTFGAAFILKLFRRVAEGVNPEAEVTRALTEWTRFASTPRLFAHLEYQPRSGPPAVLGVVQALVSGARDGWQWVLDRLAALYGAARGEPTPAGLRDHAGEVLAGLRRLGSVTGGLHVALASIGDDPAFAPEPITRADLVVWTAAVRARLAEARAALGRDAVDVPAALVDAALEGLLGRVKIRHHGDLHLGQTLYRPDAGDFVIIDFEGEPLRPLAERRLKHAAARDVAGLLRSVDYAAAVSLAAAGGRRDEVAPWAEAWRAAAAAEIVEGYRDATAGAPFRPDHDDDFARAIAAFELEKAAYEVVYEANTRPAWIAIPRRGLITAAARLSQRPASSRPGAA